MLRTVEATIDRDGTVRLAEPVVLAWSTRALVTILDATATVDGGNEAAVLAESSLSEAWSGEAEDRAWAHLADLPEIGEGDA